MKTLSLICRLVAAAILFQTLWFKFSGAEESKFIFASLHAEPYGRWFAGISELIAGLLLLAPGTQVLGALIGIGIMLGAILSHIFVLGIDVKGDGGLLFALSCVVLLLNLFVLLLERARLKRNIETMKTLVTDLRQGRKAKK